MKINMNNAFRSVRSRMSNVSRRIQATLSDINDSKFLRAKARREKDAQRYVTFRNWGTYTSPIVNELYLMREPLANFAKAHNITIDVYNPQVLTKEKPAIEGIPERFALLVENVKNNKTKVEIFEGDPSIVYPKEKFSSRMINISGEQDLQIIKNVKSSIEDSPMTHIFRTLENMVNLVK